MSDTDVVSLQLIGLKFGCLVVVLEVSLRVKLPGCAGWHIPTVILDLPQLCSECLCWNILKSKKKKFLFHMFILGGAQLALLHCRFSHFVIENKTYLSLVGFGLSNNTHSKRCDPAHLKYVVEVTPHVSASWATETRARPQICCRYARESESDIDSNQLCTRLVRCTVHKEGGFFTWR